MQLYHSTDTDGITLVRPTTEAMRAILQQVSNEDPESSAYPEVCLMNDSIGWSILVYPTAIATLEIDSAGEAIQFIQLSNCLAALELWKLLAIGDTKTILDYPWATEV